MMPRLGPLEKSLGVSFKDRALLRLALVHSSYVNENPGETAASNERLEFLGDALIGVVTAHELYKRHTGLPEGELTTLRSALVRGETLAAVAGSLHLGDHLIMGRGEEASGGRERPSNLAASFEALVGALYLDQGYEVTCSFVLNALSKELLAVDRREVPSNPKAELQELVQGEGNAPPSYRVVEVSGKDHDRRFTVEVLVSGKVKGSGRGQRKSHAEQEAAREALKALGQEP